MNDTYANIVNAMAEAGCKLTEQQKIVLANMAQQGEQPDELKYPELLVCPWCDSKDRAHRKLRFGSVPCAHDWHTDAPAAQVQQGPVAPRYAGFMQLGGCPFCGKSSCVAGQCRSAPAPHPDTRTAVQQMVDALKDACPVFLDRGKAHGAAIAAGQKLLKELK